VGEEVLAAVEKTARRQNALILFEDESGVSLLPSVRATWAPRGQTPVLGDCAAVERRVASGSWGGLGGRGGEAVVAGLGGAAGAAWGAGRR